MVSFTDEGNDIISFSTEKGKSYIISGFTPKSASDVPTEFKVAAQSGLDVTLSWNKSETAAYYNIYKADGSDMDYTLITSVPAGTTSYTHLQAYTNSTKDAPTV